MAPHKNEIWWGNLSGIPVQFGKKGVGVRSLRRCLWPVLRTNLLAVASMRDLTYWPQQARNCSVYSEWNCFRTVIMPTTKGALSIWSVGRLATIVPERRIHQELAELDEENHEKNKCSSKKPPSNPPSTVFDGSKVSNVMEGLTLKFGTRSTNRPLHSCVLSILALGGSQAGGDRVFKRIMSHELNWGFYQKRVTTSVASTQRLGSLAYNCKLAYWK